MKIIFKLLAMAAFVFAYGCIGGIDVGNLSILKGLAMLAAFTYAGFIFADIAGRLD